MPPQFAPVVPAADDPEVLNLLKQNAVSGNPQSEPEPLPNPPPPPPNPPPQFAPQDPTGEQFQQNTNSNVVTAVTRQDPEPLPNPPAPAPNPPPQFAPSTPNGEQFAQDTNSSVVTAITRQEPTPVEVPATPTTTARPQFAPAPTTADNADQFNQNTNNSIVSQITRQEPVPLTDPAAAQASASQTARDGGNFKPTVPGGQEGNVFVTTTNNSVVGAITNPNANISPGNQNPRVPDGAGGTSANRNLNPLGEKQNAQSQNAAEGTSPFKPYPDWRVRIGLAPQATYLYKAADPGILQPLAATNGVVFPYTPSIGLSYTAAYDNPEVTHSNYRLSMYKSSAVSDVTISGDFTAQDTQEANYMLAVIHFFRSVTKMFYGQDQQPRNGTPPPLVYLSGLGAYQFDNHPMVISSFSYQLPSDVDYIRAAPPGSSSKLQVVPGNKNFPTSNANQPILDRLKGIKVQQGGVSPPPAFNNLDRSAGGSGAPVTYVPTKITISIVGIPIVTRNDISNNFSLKEYATGRLLRGSVRGGVAPNSGGFW